MKLKIAALAIWIFQSSCVFAASSGNAEYQKYTTPARFKVTTKVVNKDLQPYTATIGGFGNSFINTGGGFEPVVFRNKFIVSEDSPNRVIATPDAISHWDSLREGMLDGAAVQVYRAENGKINLVREDKVAHGGFAASGWEPIFRDNTVLPGTQNRFRFRWSDYNRPGVPYYFAVRAIDRNGNISPFSKAVAVVRPASVGKGEVRNLLAPYQAAKLAFDGNPPPPPLNLRSLVETDGSLTLEWAPVIADDLAGYLVYRSDYSPETHRGHHIQLSGHAASSRQGIKAGDMVIVSKKFYSASRNRYHTNRVWGAGNENRLLMPGLVDFFPDEDPGLSWELVPHGQGSPVAEAGETFMRLRVDSDRKAMLGTYNHSGTDQDWYDVLESKPYKAEVWLRHEGRGSVRFNLPGYYDRPPHQIHPIEFRPGPRWQKFTATFTPPAIQSGARPNQMALEFSGPGIFEVDNFRVYRADHGYLDYSENEYLELKLSGMQALRTHGFIKTGRKSYDMDQLTNAGGVIDGTVRLNTLPQTLAMLRKARMRPWLQIEPHMTPAEWQAFVEYMAAPYDPALDTPQAKPWAHKRHGQGQTRPWVDEFDRIYFEVGNETWNRLFRPWTFDALSDAATGKRYTAGQVYGLFQEHVRDQLRSSPYWRAARLDDKFVFVLGGWSGFSYGTEAASTSPSSAHMTIAGYNGGWDEAEGPPGLNPASFFNVLNQVSQAAIPAAERHAKEVQDVNAGRSRARLHVGTYEAGPGYALNGLNNAKVSEQQAGEQEAVMKSLAAGTATLDSFLARANLGFATQNFFTFGQGSRWKSHAKWHYGGQAHPSWKALALYNTQATGDMLATQAIGVPIVDLKAFGRRALIKNAPLVAVYATRKGNRLNLFVISRKIPDYPFAGNDGFSPVVIDLPLKSASAVTLHKMSGTHAENNLKADKVRIEQVKLPASTVNSSFAINRSTGVDDRGLPPASILLYVFEDAVFDTRE
jgi:hypothetical protein